MGFLSGLLGLETQHEQHSTAKATSFTVTIPARLAGMVAQAAQQLGITKAQLVKRALSNALEEIEDLKTVEARRGEKSIPWSRAKSWYYNGTRTETDAPACQARRATANRG